MSLRRSSSTDGGLTKTDRALALQVHSALDVYVEQYNVAFCPDPLHLRTESAVERPWVDLLVFYECVL